MSESGIILAPEEMWAVVELMGHGQTAGRVEKPTEWGGLMRVDVPDDDGTYRTEFYSMQAIYSVKFVSEEIARAFAPKKKHIAAYDAPIVTRDEHHAVVNALRVENHRLEARINELNRRLTAVNPPPNFYTEETDDSGDVSF